MAPCSTWFSTMTPILSLLLAAALGAATPAMAAPVTPIASLDVPRYLGAWYEIAKYPNRFQKQCDGYTTAHYSLLPDRSLQVINRCRRADGRIDEAVGSARQLGRPIRPSSKCASRRAGCPSCRWCGATTG
jgi:apolipoprotein D and lipocalin family protein